MRMLTVSWFMVGWSRPVWWEVRDRQVSRILLIIGPKKWPNLYHIVNA